MQEIIKDQPNITIQVILYNQDGEVVTLQRASKSWETAQEDLGKLERAVAWLEKEELIKE